MAWVRAAGEVNCDDRLAHPQRPNLRRRSSAALRVGLKARAWRLAGAGVAAGQRLDGTPPFSSLAWSAPPSALSHPTQAVPNSRATCICSHHLHTLPNCSLPVDPHHRQRQHHVGLRADQRRQELRSRPVSLLPLPPPLALAIHYRLRVNTRPIWKFSSPSLPPPPAPLSYTYHGHAPSPAAH